MSLTDVNANQGCSLSSLRNWAFCSHGEDLLAISPGAEEAWLPATQTLKLIRNSMYLWARADIIRIAILEVSESIEETILFAAGKYLHWKTLWSHLKWKYRMHVCKHWELCSTVLKRVHIKLFFFLIVLTISVFLIVELWIRQRPSEWRIWAVWSSLFWRWCCHLYLIQCGQWPFAFWEDLWNFRGQRMHKLSAQTPK